MVYTENAKRAAGDGEKVKKFVSVGKRQSGTGKEQNRKGRGIRDGVQDVGQKA